MDVITAIRRRYSVRAYKTDPIEDRLIIKVLNAARLAPTASNRQPFQIVVVHTAGREEEILSIYAKPWFVQAPLILSMCCYPEKAWVRKDGKQYFFVDAAIVMDHMVLMATKLGLGTCFVAAFDEANARKVLALPDEVVPVLFTPLGYPAVAPKIKARKKLAELVRYEHW